MNNKFWYVQKSKTVSFCADPNSWSSRLSKSKQLYWHLLLRLRCCCSISLQRSKDLQKVAKFKYAASSNKLLSKWYAKTYEAFSYICSNDLFYVMNSLNFNLMRLARSEQTTPPPPNQILSEQPWRWIKKNMMFCLRTYTTPPRKWWILSAAQTKSFESEKNVVFFNVQLIIYDLFPRMPLSIYSRFSFTSMICFF